jgi:predicted Ser/Thr protein kinase
MTQRYQVNGKLGHGGLGEVYLAYDTQLDREVALKRVRTKDSGDEGHKALAADLVREAKTLSALQHPNVVTIFDVGSDEQGPFVVMEYLKGETLDQVVERGRITVEDFREIVLQTMEGMVAAGSLGLVHRDLKPGNLMVNWLPTGKLQLKILDFGLAKFSRSAAPQTQDHEAGIMGSIYFMAPEQFERLPLDARTDLYSLGCIFYQLLTQKHPFEGSRGVDVMVSHLQHLVTPLHEHRSDVPSWMADWVMWLISREMDDRPADARTAMQYFLEGKSGLKSAAPAKPVARAAGTAPVKGTAPVRQPALPRQSSLPPPGPVPATGGVPPGRGRPGSHVSAVRSRGRPRRVDGHVKGLPKEKVHGMTVLTGVILLGICGYIGWRIYDGRDRTAGDPRAILIKLAGEAPQGDSSHVRELVQLAESRPEDAKDCLAVLTKLQGEDVPAAIASELESSEGPVRDMLMEAAAARPSKESITLLMKIAGDDMDNAVRTRALAAIAKACTPSDLVQLLSHAVKFQEDPLRTVYYKTVETLLSKEVSPDQRALVLAPALKDAGPASQPSLFQLLGATGSPEAHKVLAAEISAAGPRRRAAAEAVNSWNAPDISIARALLDAAKSGDRDLYTGLAARTYGRIPTLTAPEVVANLKLCMPYTDSVRSRAEFSAAVGSLGSKEAVDLANEIAGGPDPALANAMKPEVENVTKHQAAAITLIKGDNNLDGSNAVILTTEVGDAQYSAAVRHITGWRSRKTRLAWDIIVPESMSAEVDIVQSSVVPGGSYFVTIGSKSIETSVVQTTSSDAFMRVTVGQFELRRTGAWRLYIEPGRITEKETLMNVRSITVRVK